jgi:hypothetical protein
VGREKHKASSHSSCPGHNLKDRMKSGGRKESWKEKRKDRIVPPP